MCYQIYLIHISYFIKNVETLYMLSFKIFSPHRKIDIW